MPRQLPALGIAPDDGPFFVSAGPDGSFLTLADNLYSYDLPALLPRPGQSPSRPTARRPATAPSAIALPGAAAFSGPIAAPSLWPRPDAAGQRE
jgi:hypothetical protein